MVYYGLSLGVNLIGGDIFLNSFLSGAIEIPCYFIVIPIMDKFGRRRTTIGSLIGAGISCFVCIWLFNKPGLFYIFVHLLLRLYWALQQARFVLHLCTSHFQRRILRRVESYRDWTSSLMVGAYVSMSVLALATNMYLMFTKRF